MSCRCSLLRTSVCLTRCADAAFVLLVALVLAAGVASAQTTPMVATDMADYPPGATAQITGAGFWPGETVTLHVVHIDGVGSGGAGHEPWTLIAGMDGSFTSTWYVDPDDSLGSTFLLTATGGSSGFIAQTTFTDMNVGTYDQCSNNTGTGYLTDDTGCRWINGNLNANNSIYFEGDATVQRLWLTGFIPGTTHSVTLKYGTTKGGKHAYDFLTTWTWSEDWITLADRCQGITGCEAAAPGTTTEIPLDPTYRLLMSRSRSVTGNS